MRSTEPLRLASPLHVAPGRDNANPGAPESPLRTMQKATEVTRAGDTVLVRGGAYHGHMFPRYSDEPEKPIVFGNGWDGIKFFHAYHVVLEGDFIHDNLNQGILGNGQRVRIDGNVIAHNVLKPDNEKRH